LNKIKAILYLLSIAAIAYFVFKYKESLSIISNLDYGELSFLLILAASTIGLHAFQFLIIARVIDKGISFLPMLGITSLSSMYNYILPASGGGIAVRAALLNQKLGITWSRIAALMSVFYVSSYYGVSFLLLITSSIVYYFYALADELYLAIIAFFVLLSVLILLLYNWKPTTRTVTNKFKQFLQSTLEGLEKFKGEYSKLFASIICQITIVAIAGTKLYFVFSFLELDISYWKVFMVQSFLALSLVLSLTPGNFGIREGLIVLFAGFLNLSVESALLGAVLDRATNVLMVLLLGVASKFWYLK